MASDHDKSEREETEAEIVKIDGELRALAEKRDELRATALTLTAKRDQLAARLSIGKKIACLNPAELALLRGGKPDAPASQVVTTRGIASAEEAGRVS